MLDRIGRSWIAAGLMLSASTTSIGCHRYVAPGEIASTPAPDTAAVPSPRWRRWPGSDQPLPNDAEVAVSDSAEDHASSESTMPTADTADVLRRLSDADPGAREAALEDLFAETEDKPPPLPIDELRSEDVTVRVAAIASLGQRSDDEARQLLIEQLSSGGERLRQASIESLAAVGEWNAVEQRSRGIGDANRQTSPLDDRPQQFAVTDDVIRSVRELVSQLDRASTATEVEQIRAQLAGHGPVLVAAVEQLVRNGPALIHEDVYQEILPQLDQDFATLLDLQAENVVLRRRASDRMAGRATEQPLAWMVIHRLAEVSTGEQDVLVWKNILEAIHIDSSQPAVRLAVVALSHPDAEIRVKGCAYLQRHPQPDGSELLMPSLADENDGVVLAAVRALREVPSIKDSRALQQLLAAPNKTLRVEAATTLAALKSADGVAALERLAYDKEETVRRMVASAMGDLGDQQFAATLILLLDDRASVRNAALRALPQVTGHDINTDGDPSTRVDQWKSWHRDRT